PLAREPPAPSSCSEPWYRDRAAAPDRFPAGPGGYMTPKGERGGTGRTEDVARDGRDRHGHSSTERGGPPQHRQGTAGAERPGPRRECVPPLPGNVHGGGERPDGVRVRLSRAA